MKMEKANHPITYLKDYQPPDFFVMNVDLQFELMEDKAIVKSQLKMTRNVDTPKDVPLRLHGDHLKLISLKQDDIELKPSQYEQTEQELILKKVGENVVLEIVTEIYPKKNTALSGLYCSGKLFCTQCEAQGFRRITYYLDRPDVMAPFTTSIIANKKRYPILLSNGNKIAKGDLSENRHFVTWQDPFKKPSYLFALVAGDLILTSEYFTTKNAKSVKLEIFVEPQNKEKTHYAMQALKKAMRWDENEYGREYDLDIYMIVAVNDFNMGAMENKGLNIFNSKYVLADDKTATDSDFQNVEAVIGHEYFHNWTGNRITCRDWFQLSLKEGLTVFREQQFFASLGSPTVKRINDARIIRTRQFAEDASPMAHPVRPEAYMEINNFYTSTVYNKGAEIIRMLWIILGAERFRKGMDLYFERHDGQAVTIEDFIKAFEDANKIDLTQFSRWYYQAGTPEVSIKDHYDAKSKQFKLILTQSLSTTQGKSQMPFVIPIKIALYDDKGVKMKVSTVNEDHFLILTKASQEFVFDNITVKPLPSLLGSFSAPIKLNYPYTDAELELLMICDDDLFNRWDASQRLSTNAIKKLMKNHQSNQSSTPMTLIEAYRKLMQQHIIEPALTAQLLAIPSFNYIAQDLPIIEVNALISARRKLIHDFAVNLEDELFEIYVKAHEIDDGQLSDKSMGYRALKNICLYYLIKASAKWLTLAQKQYENARNMTDKMGALNALNHSSSNLRQLLLDEFYQSYKNEPLVVNKWFALHATADLPNVISNIESLLHHESFDINNPNNVYALINTFSLSNPERFHNDEGSGYQFLANRVIELNKRNPQIAARLLEGLIQWKRLDEKHSELMKNGLLTIQATDNLSEDVYEILTKSLNQ